MAGLAKEAALEELEYFARWVAAVPEVEERELTEVA
jgi:hypothetical protein